ncbi:hypothetical protein B0H13DRAFT_2392088 [Mycena leptocephala]|nr:hypothetical protein B0H13DRAFT_2392088 [Mycena leptocephala]
MIPTVGHFILVLQHYFIREFSLKRALYILTVIVATYPLFRLHMNQRREPRQPREKAWLRSIVQILVGAFNPEHEHPHFLPEEDDVGIGLSHRLCKDLEQLYHFLGIDDGVTPFFPEPHTILCTTRINCILCLNDDAPPRATSFPTFLYQRSPSLIRLVHAPPFKLILLHPPLTYLQPTNGYLPHDDLNLQQQKMDVESLRPTSPILMRVRLATRETPRRRHCTSASVRNSDPEGSSTNPMHDMGYYAH